MWRKPQVWLGFLVSAVALFLIFRSINWDELRHALGSAQYGYLLPAAVTLVLAIWIRGERWRWLYGAQRGQVTRARSFNAIAIGYFVTNVFPLRLGEVARIFFVARDGKVSYALAASTIVVEHVLDVLVVLGLLIVVVIGGHLPLPNQIEQGALLATMAFGGALAVMLIMVWQRKRVEQLAERALSRFGRLNTKKWVQVVAHVLDGFAVLQPGWPLVMILLWSIAGWLVSAISFQFSLLAFVPSAPLTYALFSTVATTFALLLPATPGAIGTLDLAIQQSLVLFGINESVALSTALVFHVMEILVMDALGMICLLREAGSWAAAKAQLRSATSSAQSTSGESAG